MGEVDLEANVDLAEDLNIVNMVVLPNSSIRSTKVGRIERQASGEINLTIEQDAIVWPLWYKQVGERSSCNA